MMMREGYVMMHDDEGEEAYSAGEEEGRRFRGRSGHSLTHLMSVLVGRSPK